ncbi:MAG: TonB-dependent receptor, partial [bacterium]
TLNGININNPYGNTRSVGLATNAVQEVSVSSGTFSAEYGNALSGVVNYVTKEGGSNLSGSLKVLTGDHVSSHKDLFFNIDKITPTNVNRTEASLGGPIFTDDISFYASGVYNWFGGFLYGQQLYTPQDAFLYPSAFPSGDPRRGSSSDPLYFGAFSRDTSDRKGGPTGNGDVVPLNWSRSYNLQGNIRFRFTPEMRLKYEIVYDNGLSPTSSSIAYRFKPDGRSLDRSQSTFHSLEWTHSLGENAFYTLKGSYIIDNGKSFTYDDINDPRYLSAFYQSTLPNTNFLTGGTDLNRFTRKSTMIGGKFDLVAQLFTNHEVKFGAEVRSHKLEVESYTLRFGDPNDHSKSFTVEDLVHGVKLFPFIPTVNEGYINYTRKPLQLTGYLQDKIELFTSIILNLGLRYEYFDPKANYNPTISNEYFLGDSLGFYAAGAKKATVKHMLAPRFSVSYPITDRGTIRFSYGHFYQIGSLASLYSNPNFRAPQGTTPTFGNPEVNPQRSIQYELGLQQGLTDNLKIEVTGYYKDVDNYIATQRIETARGDKPYFLLTNLNYANTRGISISLLKRRSPDELLSATIDYTFQIADGNRTEPAAEIFFNEQRGQLSETYLVPFSFDRSHTITSTVTLSQPRDWSVSLLGYVRTGTPY